MSIWQADKAGLRREIDAALLKVHGLFYEATDLDSDMLTDADMNIWMHVILHPSVQSRINAALARESPAPPPPPDGGRET